MNHRIIAGILFVVSVVLSLSGYIIMHPDRVGYCNDCFHSITLSVGKPIFWGMIPLMISFLIILLARREVWNHWKWFAGIFLPIAIIWTISLPELCQGLVCTDRSGAAQDFGYIFLFVTLIIAIYQTIRTRSKA